MFGRVVPVSDASNSHNRDLHRFRDAGNQVQCDRLQRRAAIAAVRGFPAHVGLRRKCFQVHTDNRIERVDQADGVGASLFRGQRDARDVRDVGREFHDHRSFRRFLHPGRDHLRVFGNLPHGRTHAALAHAVRASEIQLERIGARVLDALHHFVPALAFGFHHQRRDHQIFRIALLHFRDFPDIHFGGPVADELDVGEAHHFRAVVIHRAVARRCVDDRLANRLPNRAAPSRVERAHHLPRRVRRRTRSKPERVRRFNAAEFYAQVGHFSPLENLLEPQMNTDRHR